MNKMSYRGYTASMIFDTEDKIIVGRVMDIVDIIGFHGESVAEFEANFHSIVDDYIETCEKQGAAPEKPASGKLMLRIAPGVHAAAIKAAAVSGKSLNKWAELVIASASAKLTLNASNGANRQEKSTVSPKVPPKRPRASRSA